MKAPVMTEVDRLVALRVRQYPRLTRARLVAMLLDARDFGRLHPPNAEIAWRHFLERTLGDGWDELPIVPAEKLQGRPL